MSSFHHDVEKGPETSEVLGTPHVLVDGNTIPQEMSRPQSTDPRNVLGNPLPPLSSSTLSASDPLTLFRNHLGINVHNELNSKDNRPAANKGIYTRVVSSERRARKQYQIFASVINGALGLQIIFASALTALGAGNGPHTAVTAFGAMNTILAGLLTFLKGSGLPNRLKFYENEWTKVREYIELRERDFAVHNNQYLSLDLVGEIQVIERMYERVRADIEANTPDSYISLTKYNQSRGTDPPPSLSRGVAQIYNNVSNDMNDKAGEFRTQITELNNNARAGLVRTQTELDRKLLQLQTNTSQGLQDIRSNTTQGLGQLQSNTTQGMNQLQSQANQNLHNTQQSLESQLRSTQQTAQSSIYQTQQAAEDRLRQTQNLAESQLRSTQQTAQSSMAQTQREAESRLAAYQQQAADYQVQASSKAKEMEEKVMQAAEKAAEKVLMFTKHRHDDSNNNNSGGGVGGGGLH